MIVKGAVDVLLTRMDQIQIGAEDPSDHGRG